MTTKVVLMTVPQPDPASSTILRSAKDEPAPIISGAGSVDLLCGGCGYAICQGLDSAGVVRNLFLACPNCDEFNRTRI